MNAQQLLYYTTQLLWLILIISLPPVLVSAIVGTLISLIQALTQIQEQSLGFIFKLVAIVITLLSTIQWYGSEIFNYTENIFQIIKTI